MTHSFLSHQSFAVFCFQAVKEQMEVMKDKDTLINVRNMNHEKLLTELESLVVSRNKRVLAIDQCQKHEKLLTELESLVVSRNIHVN